MFINVAKKILLLITLSFFTVSCGGDTRKLTTDEFVLSPRDKAKKEQLQKGGNIFKDLIGLGKKGEMDNGMIWKAEALYQRISGTTFNAATGGNAVGDGSVFNKITLDDVDTMQIRFSVAKSF